MQDVFTILVICLLDLIASQMHGIARVFDFRIYASAENEMPDILLEIYRRIMKAQNVMQGFVELIHRTKHYSIQIISQTLMYHCVYLLEQWR